LEGTRSGIKGFAQEEIIFSKSWGFRFEDIITRVHIWHGDQDTSTPLTMPNYIANLIPDSALTIIPNEGHFLLFNHWKDILTTLTTP
jgi:pimeloyl-ACP methyl ester carboxylesterase